MGASVSSKPWLPGVRALGEASSCKRPRVTWSQGEMLLSVREGYSSRPECIQSGEPLRKHLKKHGTLRSPSVAKHLSSLNTFSKVLPTDNYTEAFMCLPRHSVPHF